MKTITLFSMLICSCILFSSCSTSKTIVPMDSKLTIHDTYTIIWYGKSEAYRYQDSQYVRTPEFDYIFDVVQKRYDHTWKSIKTLHRNHPEYNGTAGERSQCMYFEIDYSKKEKALQSIIHSSLGIGKGESDHEFREQSLVLDLTDISSFSPYNKIKITQHYLYEEGELRETVELYKEKDGKIIPFMKNEEIAKFYINGKLQGPPTTLK